MSDQPSITCPKCEQVSYLRGDIENKYCGKCGYHDALHNTQPGIPGVSAKFRQPTPLMQLQATLSGVKGLIGNYDYGIGDKDSLFLLMRRALDDVDELIPHLERGYWPPDPNRDLPPPGGGIL